MKESVQKSAREYYRRSNPKRDSVLSKRQPLIYGVSKEVIDDDGVLSVKVCYSMPSSASALGKSDVTFKKWLATGLIPEPVHVDAVCSHRQYTLAEIKAMVNVLSRHFETYDYFNKHHTDTISAIKSGVEKARNA